MYKFLLCLLIFIYFYEQGFSQNEFHRHASPYSVFQSVDIDDVKWTDGFWGKQFESCHHKMIPHMWELFNNPEYSQAYNNFKVAAGLMQGRHRGAKFNDGDFYKWMEAASHSYAITKDESINTLLDEIIPVIAQSQREDGYIHTPVVIAQRQGNENKEWNDQLHFETYNMGHLMTTACVHFYATGKTTLLDVAIKAAHYLNKLSLESPNELANVTICPSHYMGIIDIYRVTNDQTFLQLAERLIDMRSLTENGGDHNQDRIPFRDQREAVGHAVRANYLYAGAADIYLENGDDSLLPPLNNIWHDLVLRKMYITGSTGALYDGASPDGSKNHSDIQLVHQAYGRAYQLPNITAYNETCATIGSALWNWRMLRMNGESRYADVLELALYNGILSGISLDGTTYFYTNPLRVVEDLPFPLRWSRERQDYYGSFCCPPNVVRIIAGISQYAYGISDNQLWVNLYGSNELNSKFTDGNSIKLKQTTAYPWDGNIRIEILESQKDEYEMLLRIPGWAENAQLSINGSLSSETLKSGSYHSMTRNWKPKDTVELKLDMPVKLMEAHPLAEELRNQTAIQRGPVIYCLESIDLPKDTNLTNVSIPLDIELKNIDEPELLEGITVLEGNVNIQNSNQWDNSLYREINKKKSSEVLTRFIPYYAWGNRGKSEMSVWLPLN